MESLGASLTDIVGLTTDSEAKACAAEDFLAVFGFDRLRVCIMVLKSLSSLMRSLCFYMFSASRLTKFAIPESFPVYFYFRAKYWFFLTSSKSTCSNRPVTSFMRIYSLVRLCSFQFLAEPAAFNCII